MTITNIVVYHIKLKYFTYTILKAFDKYPSLLGNEA